MPFQQKVFAILVCIAVFIFMLEMVRRKNLREEYSVLWLSTSVVMFLLVLKYDWLVALTHLIGAKVPTTTLFLGSIVFLTLICVQFSLKFSQLANQLKNLTQENALLRFEVTRLQERLSLPPQTLPEP